VRESCQIPRQRVFEEESCIETAGNVGYEVKTNWIGLTRHHDGFPMSSSWMIG